LPSRAPPALVLLSCEHASRRVPARYVEALRGARRLLATHRGYDVGAAAVARTLARRLGLPLFVGAATRLLCDLNRSPGHPGLLSRFSRGLPAAERARILATYYVPYRDAVTRAVQSRRARGRAVLHVSIHSFTPRLHGKTRTTDIGLLYDPARAGERRLVTAWQAHLRALAPDLRIHKNAPYRGVADCFVVALRRRFAPPGYLGVEIELGQRHVAAAAGRARMVDLVCALLAPGTRPR
jgi:predicted N-formylglutamate amidohydrolase